MDPRSSRIAYSRMLALHRGGLLFPRKLTAGSAVRSLDALATKGTEPGALFMLSAHLFGAYAPLLQFNPELAVKLQREPFPLLGLALTEEKSGSDVYALSTEALETRGGWKLTGRKTFVTNAPFAAGFLVFAKTKQGLTCFYVSAKAAGVKLVPMEEWLGLRTAAVAGLELRRARAEQVVGLPGRGAEVFRVAMAWERSLIHASVPARLDRLRASALAEARGKTRGGASLARAPMFRKNLARVRDCAAEIRSATREAARTIDSGGNALARSLQTKVLASERYVEASRILFTLGGKSAYFDASEQAENLRDSLASLLYSGPNDVLRELMRHAGISELS